MKQIIPIASLVVLVSACTANPIEITDKNKTSDYTDTVGLAQFREWKAQNELKDPNTAYNPDREEAKTEVIKERTVVYKPAKRAPARTSSGYDNYESGSMSSESANAAKAPEKTGWSKAAKGAVIGAGTGAAAGAVINKKNRVVGAVIGGVLGGGAGYGVGRHMDKKDGRY